MSEWPKYRSHRVIEAALIVGIGPAVDGARVLWVRPAGEEHDLAPVERFQPTVPEMVGQAELGGYAMRYPDGFKSVCPRATFEDGYTLVGE